MAEKSDIWRGYCTLLATLHTSPQQLERAAALIEVTHAQAMASMNQLNRQLRSDLVSKRDALQTRLEQANASLRCLNDNRFQLQQKLHPGRANHAGVSATSEILQSKGEVNLDLAIQALLQERRNQIAARRKFDEDEIRRRTEEDRLASERATLQQQRTARQRKVKIIALISTGSILIGVAAFWAI